MDTTKSSSSFPSSTSSRTVSSAALLQKQLASKRADAANENKANSGGVSSTQAIVYFAIVIACFVVVYPRMIHPMVKFALGFGGNEELDKVNQQREYPPQMMHRGKQPPPGGAGMRPPPAARGDHANADAGKGGGGGVMGMVLPIYAGGLFLYLLYAASKAYKSDGSSSKKKDPYDETYSLITERLAGLDLEKIVSGEDKSGASEINKLAEFLRRKNAGVPLDPSCIDELEMEDDDLIETVEVVENKQTPAASAAPVSMYDTDELLRKCENQETMTEDEMLRLKAHLSQMEGRMNKLMSALHTVQAKTADIAEGVSDIAAEQQDGVDEEDRLSDMSSVAHVGEDSCDSVTEADRLEVQEIYDEIGSSSEEETAVNQNDTESGGIRQRHFEVEDCSDEEQM